MIDYETIMKTSSHDKIEDVVVEDGGNLLWFTYNGRQFLVLNEGNSLDIAFLFTAKYDSCTNCLQPDEVIDFAYGPAEDVDWTYYIDKRF